MDHDELESLVAAYALSALDPEERDIVARHLTSCERCSRKASELMVVAATLPSSVESREPPPALKGRILAAVREEKRLGQVSLGVGNGHQTVPAARTVPTAARREEKPARPGAPAFLRRLFVRPLVPAAAAALAMVAVAALGFWAAQLGARLDKTEETLDSSYEALLIMAQADQKWTFTGTAEAPNVRGVLAYSSRRQVSSMVVWGMPVSDGTSYAAWTVRGGAPARVGDMTVVDLGMWIIIPGDVHAIEGVGVTARETNAPPDAQGTVVLRASIPSAQ